MSKKIHSLTGGITLQVRHIDSDGYALINVGDLPKPTGNGYFSESASRYPVAELAAALGLVTLAYHDEITNEAQRQIHALEADLREADRARDAACDTRDDLAAEVTQWQHTAAENEHEANDLRAERDRAKEALGRVWELTVDGDGEWVHVGDLRAALDPKPASKRVILTADMAGVKVNGYDFTKGVLVTLPAEDADRLISAGLAKDADQ